MKNYVSKLTFALLLLAGCGDSKNYECDGNCDNGYGIKNGMTGDTKKAIGVMDNSTAWANNFSVPNRSIWVTLMMAALTMGIMGTELIMGKQ